MIFVLKRTPAFQLFGPFQNSIASRDFEQREALCVLPSGTN